MSQKYFKPLHKFIARSRAVDKLRIPPSQFDELCVLSGVFPVLAAERNALGREDGWYYLISDIKKIYYSDAFNVIRTNKRKELRRDKYRKYNLIDKLNNCIDEEYALVDLVKNKYASFGDALSALGQSVRNLYLVERLSISDVSNVLRSFENFLISRRLLNAVFMAKNAIFFSFNCEKIRVVWSVPYPSDDFNNLIEIKKDICKAINTSGIKLPDFPSDESETEEDYDPNDPNKLDISLLKYASPLLGMHLRLVLCKLETLFPEAVKPGVFHNLKVCVLMDSLRDSIEFVLKCEGAALSIASCADLIIAETVDELLENTTYVHPQFVADSVNSGKLLDVEKYRIGKELPVHLSPFPDVFELLDGRVLKTLSNTKKYKIQDRIEELG